MAGEVLWHERVAEFGEIGGRRRDRVRDTVSVPKQSQRSDYIIEVPIRVPGWCNNAMVPNKTLTGWTLHNKNALTV